MNRLTRLALRVLVALALVTGASSRPLAAQNPPAQAVAPLARAVRVALGHANLDEARRVMQASRESASKKAVAAALIAIYEGKDDEARRVLEPLATGAGADDDAVLELGLLEWRHGRKEAATALLDRVMQGQADLDTDAFMRIARAAAAIGDVTRG